MRAGPSRTGCDTRLPRFQQGSPSVRGSHMQKGFCCRLCFVFCWNGSSCNPLTLELASLGWVGPTPASWPGQWGPRASLREKSWSEDCFWEPAYEGKGQHVCLKNRSFCSITTDMIIWERERHATIEKIEGPPKEFTLCVGTPPCWQEFNYSFPASTIPCVQLTKRQPSCVTTRGSSWNPLA